jgi:hypothetical protein
MKHGARILAKSGAAILLVAGASWATDARDCDCTGYAGCYSEGAGYCDGTTYWECAQIEADFNFVALGSCDTPPPGGGT